jgi:hypothetical protein
MPSLLIISYIKTDKKKRDEIIEGMCDVCVEVGVSSIGIPIIFRKKTKPTGNRPKNRVLART